MLARTQRTLLHHFSDSGTVSRRPLRTNRLEWLPLRWEGRGSLATLPASLATRTFLVTTMRKDQPGWASARGITRTGAATGNHAEITARATVVLFVFGSDCFPAV